MNHQRITIFSPLSRQQATALRETGGTADQLEGYAPTTRMLTAHEYTPAEAEDAGYAAQVYARICGLARHGRDVSGSDGGAPLVIAADVSAASVTEGTWDADHGAVRIAGLSWDDVTAVFGEEHDARPAVRTAADALARTAASSAASPPRLDECLALPAVHQLLNDHEQLWHHPAEDW